MTKNNIQAIILDIDGVIVGEKIGYNSPHPHSDVLSKLSTISANGTAVILCTAKPHFAIGDIIRGANLSNPHITDGGGVLICPVSNTVLKKSVIDSNEAKRIIKACLQNNIYIEAYTTDKYIIQNSQVCDITPQHTHILQTPPTIVDDILSVDEEITKIMPVVHGDTGKKDFGKLFNSLNTDLVLSWGVHPVALPLQFGIITAAGISKREGALDILDSLNISPENTLAVGDSTSDWQFIEMCKYAAAMDNATSELKELALTKGTNATIGGHVDQNGALEIFDFFKL
jgi:hypothetical protein